MAQEEKSEDHLTYSKSPWGQHECLYQVSLHCIWMSGYFSQDTNVKLLVAQQEKKSSQSPISSGYTLWVPWTSLQNIVPVDILLVKTCEECLMKCEWNSSSEDHEICTRFLGNHLIVLVFSLNQCGEVTDQQTDRQTSASPKACSYSMAKKINQ